MKEESAKQVVVPSLSWEVPVLPFSTNSWGGGGAGQVMAVTVGFCAGSLLTLCFSPYRPSMAGSSSTWPSCKHLFKVIPMVLVALVLLHSASSESPQDFGLPGQQKREVPVDLLSQTGRSVRRTLDAWVGPETMHLASEVRKAVPDVAACTDKGEGGDVIRGHPILALYLLCVKIPSAESPKFYKRKQYALPLFKFYPEALNSTPSLPCSCPFLAERLGNESFLQTHVTG